MSSPKSTGTTTVSGKCRANPHGTRVAYKETRFLALKILYRNRMTFELPPSSPILNLETFLA